MRNQLNFQETISGWFWMVNSSPTKPVSNSDSSFGSIPLEDVDFNTPLPPSAFGTRGSWRDQKAESLYPSLRRIRVMEDLSSLKRGITRTLNTLDPKLDEMEIRANNLRSNKSFDRDCADYELVHNDLDDLSASNKLITDRIKIGESNCELLDSSDDTYSKWKGYLAEKHDQICRVQEILILLENTIKRADERSEFKLKLTSASASKIIDQISPSVETPRVPRTENRQLRFTPGLSENGEAEILPTNQDSNSTILQNSSTWGNRRSTRARNLANSSSVVTPQLHLPKHFFEVEIPKFDGTYETWDNFWAMFDKFVHSQNFENSVKLSILSKHCIGSARKYVDLARQNGDFYERTIDKMINSFDNAYKKRNSLLKALETIRKPGNSPASMEITISRIRTIVQGLDTCDEINSSNLQRDIKMKFPVEVIMKMEKKERNHVGSWTTEDLLNALDEEIEIRQLEEDTRTNLRVDVSSSINKPSRVVNLSSNFAPIGSNGSYCFFHNKKGHSSGDCRKSVDAESVRKIARENNLCLNCLDPGHRTQNCTKSGCKVCGKGKHNFRICNSSNTVPQQHSESVQNNGTTNNTNTTPNFHQNSNNTSANPAPSRFIPRNSWNSNNVQNNPALNNNAAQSAPNQNRNNYGQNTFRPSQ